MKQIHLENEMVRCVRVCVCVFSLPLMPASVDFDREGKRRTEGEGRERDRVCFCYPKLTQYFYSSKALSTVGSESVKQTSTHTHTRIHI